ncbi:hypothetical protein [Kineococcus sp. SYSU DK006]|uniref:hypothetical protein n=1 Tax=Kineococcus sp. SYSU DK006 TaxID=3383127 RepID=UPI003D7D8D16
MVFGPDWLDWGNVPAWAGVGSLIYAGSTFARQGKELAKENKRRREQQARQVHVISPRWAGQSVYAAKDDDGNPLEDAYEIHSLKLAVHNSSGHPIRQVRTHYVIPPGYQVAKTTRVTDSVNIGPTRRKEWSETVKPELNPNRVISDPEADEWGLFRREGLLPHAVGELPEVWATFEDSDGYFWKRSLNGRLEELNELPVE